METPKASAFARGTTIGRYVILDVLGRGGMGVVYGAYDPQIDRRIAVKVLHKHLASDEMRGRFLREAQALGRLTHPNVVTVHDAGRFDEHVFMAMEHIVGRTLRTWLRERTPSWREALAMFEQAGRGLAAAHGAGIVHRDFKPDNVLVSDDGRVLVTDFGLARAPADRPRSEDPDATFPPQEWAGPSEPLTEYGRVLGTLGYISPEQARGEECDARSDQWSFCAALYFALYGEPPLRGRSLGDYLLSIELGPIEPPAVRGVPPWVRRALRRGLQLRAADRYPSMAALLQALRRDPRVIVGRNAVLVAFAIAAGAVIWNLARHEPTPLEACLEDEGRLVESTWNDSARAQVRSAFTGSGAADAAGIAGRVVTELDAYTLRWTGARAAACDATRVRHVASEEQLLLRFTCLERRRTELGALVGLLERADRQVVGRAMEAAYALTPPAECADPSSKSVAALPANPDDRAHVLEARKALAESASLAAAGKLRESLTRADVALGEARAARDRGTEAEVLLHVGDVQEASGVYDDALAPYTQAIAAAESAGDDATLAQAAARLAFVEGDKLLHLEEADRWLALADAALVRLGPNEAVEAMVLAAHAPLPTASGHPEASLPLLERLVPLSERVYGPSHPNTARALNNLGFAQQMLGRHAAALETHHRAQSIRALAFGPDAPTLAVDYCNIGSSLIGLGRYAEAAGALDRAAALAAAGDPESFWIGWALQYAGLAALRSGDPARALANAQRGLALAERRGTPAAKLLPGLLTVEGRAWIAAGEATRAEDACKRAIDADEETAASAPDRVYEWDPLTCYGEALLVRGRADDAIPALERSVLRARRVYPGDLARARFTLARALVQARRDPARARELTDQARQDLDSPDAESTADDVKAEVTRWLATSAARPLVVDRLRQQPP